MNYSEKLKKSIRTTASCLCVGLDPNIDRIPVPLKKKFGEPESLVLSFLEQVIEKTEKHCAAYKPNLGFFEALGPNGLRVFQQVLDLIPEGHIVIADAKRGDISSTAVHYAKAYFDTFDVDAITVSPLMGFESLDPFLDYEEKAVYTLTLTSNPGSADFLMKSFAGEPSMAAYIAKQLHVMQPKSKTRLGMVVGATNSDEIRSVIGHHPEAPLLIPGIGAQGGAVSELHRSIEAHTGISLINASRSILYAGVNSADWATAIEEKARAYKQQLHPITENYV